ncbi:Spy/CpxP family protein refolding chaperone [Comamonas sp. GB3 AK4-5]|uniref:Spy/CpxP family protein refolding chaperone n=1 Tax=Comamonas sp. GB3 AK4-5 TaxID=3231487 RepID=UPI00351DAC56
MAILQRTLLATAAAAAISGAFTLPVWAQSNTAPTTAAATATAPAAPHMGAQRGQRHAMDRTAMHAQHMERLKALLQLSNTQEASWKQFVDGTQPAERQGKHMDREAWSKLTTPQRIEQMQTLRKERNAAAERRESATKTFYASLNPPQQKAFDAAMPMHGQRMHKGHGGAHGHGQGHERGQGPRAMPAPAGA